MSGCLSLVAMVLALNPDAAGVQSLMELAANQSAQSAPSRGDAVPTGVLLAAMAQVEALIEHEGLPLDGASQEWLRERLIRRLEGRMRAMPAQAGPARTEAWEQLVREVTTASLAQEVLNVWLDLPPLALPEASPVTGKWTQTSQLEGAEFFSLESVAVIEEVGSEGLANRLIDPGEWVRLEVTFLNATRLPWFSTSAVAHSTGCLWVDEKRSSLVGEMAPGKSATVALWAFVPEQCREPSTLRLSLADTHRGTPVGWFVIAVTPTSFSRPHAAKSRLDTDALGSSDGSRRVQVGPSMRFEFSADVRVPGDAVASVASQWQIPNAARALFKSLTFRVTPGVPQGAGLFLAGDDLDGETIDEDGWASLAASPSLERWMITPASGRLWLAMDTTVQLNGAQPRPVLPPAPPARGTKLPTLMSPVRPAAPLAQTVAELVKLYVELEPHAVVAEKPHAVEAVSGYELLFNRVGFIKAYEALLAPPQPVVVAEEAPTAVYLVRSYLALPAVPVERAPELRTPEPTEELPPPPPPPRAEAPRRTWLQLDVGGGLSVFATRPTADFPSLWAGNDLTPFPTLGVRAFIGPHLVGVLGFHYATLSSVVGNRTSSFIEISGDLGAGYRFQWGRASFTPYAALLLRGREHSLIGSDGGSLGGLLALNTRIAITSWFGLALDLAVPLTIGGPTGFDRSRTAVYVVSGPGFRATANLSIAF